MYSYSTVFCFISVTSLESPVKLAFMLLGGGRKTGSPKEDSTEGPPTVCPGRRHSENKVSSDNSEQGHRHYNSYFFMHILKKQWERIKAWKLNQWQFSLLSVLISSYSVCSISLTVWGTAMCTDRLVTLTSTLISRLPPACMLALKNNKQDGTGIGRYFENTDTTAQTWTLVFLGRVRKT